MRRGDTVTIDDGKTIGKVHDFLPVERTYRDRNPTAFVVVQLPDGSKRIVAARQVKPATITVGGGST